MTIYTITDQFNIAGKIGKNKLNLIMKVPEGGHVTTATLPMTLDLLEKYLPSIFKSECFNEENKKFEEECKSTELGHLFEHILLENLCKEKLASGDSDAIYEGITNWNWEKDPMGTFYIEINVGEKEFKIVRKAFLKSIFLLKKLVIN